jgi:hypothetical protein
MQHIGVRSENERGEPIADFDTNSIDFRIVTEAPETSVCLRFIDTYGDLLINQLQLPLLIAELEDMSRRTTDCGFKKHIAKLVHFLKDSEDTHVYVRFIGD